MTQQAPLDSEPTKLTLEIVHNGVEKALDARPDERVSALLQQAIRLFGVTHQPHLLSLYREDGTKVAEDQTVKSAGLKDGTVLYLRPDSVKGGGR